MANEFENLISNFLIPDSNVIKESTIKLKEALKNHECISKICYLINSSSNIMVRQYACVILKNKILKKHQWKNLKHEEIVLIQDTILKSLMQENEKIVLSMSCNVMAHIVKHKLEQSSWPDFFTNLNNLILNPQQDQRERGCFIVQEVLTPANSLHFVARHLHPMFTQTFSHILSDMSQSNLQSAYYIAKSIINILPSMSDMEGEAKLIDKWGDDILKLIKLYINTDEEKASELIEFYMDMLECDCIDSPAILNKYTTIYLQMLGTETVPDSLRIKAAYFLRAMVVDKKKVLHKYKMIEKIIEIIVPIFAAPNPNDELDDEFYEEESYQSSILGSVTDLMEEIAINVSPGKFLPHLLKRVEFLLTPTGDELEPYRQRGAYLILASIVPGCPAYIKQKYLDGLVKCVLNGVKSQHPVVQKSAFYALSYFADSLQPEIINYHEEVMPLLYERVARFSTALTRAVSPEGNQLNSNDHLGTANKEEIESCLIKAFTAFETFIENMDKDILEGYLPTIVSNMMQILKTPELPSKLKEFAISAVSATASAAEELMQPYLGEIIGILEKYLVETNNISPESQEQSENQRLQIQSIDALNMFSRCLNPSKHKSITNTDDQDTPFSSFTRKCLEYSVKTLSVKTDPDVKSVIYGLLGGISALMKKDMTIHLETILTHFSESLTSTNEMMQTKGGQGEKDTLTKLFDMIQDEPKSSSQRGIQNGDGAFGDSDMVEDSEEEAQEGDEDLDDNLAVENAYIEEKENALLHLGEIASNLGSAFIPYLQPMYTKVLPMIYHTYLDVQCEAIKCLAQFCSCLATAVPLDSDLTSNNMDKSAVFAYNLIAYDCLNKFLEICKDDDNKDVVCACLEAINQIMKDTLKKKSLLSNCNLYDGVVTIVKRAIRKKLKCQVETSVSEENDQGVQHSGEDKKDEEVGDTETDELLVQTAYECVPTLCNLLNPVKFATNPQYLPFFLNDITKKLIKPLQSEEETSVAERSFLLGLLADLVSEIPTETDFEGKQSIIETFYRLILDGLTRNDISHLLSSNTTEDTSGITEILSNAVFAIGCLLFTNPWILLDDTKYPIIKFKLEQILEHKFGSAPPNTKLSPDEQMLSDNCVAAFSRISTVLALNNHRLEDLEKFTGLILKNIPLKRDQTENLTVYKFLATLWASHNQIFMNPTNAPLLCQAIIAVIIKDKVEGEAETYLKQLFMNICQTPVLRSYVENMYQHLTPHEKLVLDPLLIR